MGNMKNNFALRIHNFPLLASLQKHCSSHCRSWQFITVFRSHKFQGFKISLKGPI